MPNQTLLGAEAQHEGLPSRDAVDRAGYQQPALLLLRGFCNQAQELAAQSLQAGIPAGP